MDNKTFNLNLQTRISKIKLVLDKKGEEYSPGQDRLSNFKTTAAMLHCTPERALLGFMAKHLISIMEAIDYISNVHNAPLSYEFWEEKIGDSINYLILLENLILERDDTPDRP
jgi:hypothetical protein